MCSVLYSGLLWMLCCIDNVCTASLKDEDDVPGSVAQEPTTQRTDILKELDKWSNITTVTVKQYIGVFTGNMESDMWIAVAIAAGGTFVVCIVVYFFGSILCCCFCPQRRQRRRK